ncbi:MAG: mediator of RNA polymerase II transcription subunit 8 [Stictis urceolatum]|nr:mediator of RNA polymerase II transcription subunit 8 [Stictis urceolata]
MSTTLAQQDIKALEQLRQRLSQLTNSINTLQRDLQTTELLPPWPHLTSLLSIIAQNLSGVGATQATHAALLSSLAVYPLPTYPGRTQEGLLEQLLRKKLEPGVEDWVSKGLAAGLAIQASANAQEGPGVEELKGLWQWAGGAANEQARVQNWGGDYTKEEVGRGVEGVRTGLKRKLRVPGEESEESSGSEEGEDEDFEGMEERVGVRRSSQGGGVELDVSPPEKREEGSAVPLAEQWRFMMTGQLPKGMAG